MPRTSRSCCFFDASTLELLDSETERSLSHTLESEIAGKKIGAEGRGCCKSFEWEWFILSGLYIDKADHFYHNLAS